MKFAICILLALFGHTISQNQQQVFVPGVGLVSVVNANPNGRAPPPPGTLRLVLGPSPNRPSSRRNRPDDRRTNDPAEVDPRDDDLRDDDLRDDDPAEVAPRRRNRRPSKSFKGYSYPAGTAYGSDDLDDEPLPSKAPSRRPSRNRRPSSSRRPSRRPTSASRRQRNQPQVLRIEIAPQQGNGVDAGTGGFQPGEGTGGFQPGAGTGGFQPNVGNQGIQPNGFPEDGELPGEIEGGNPGEVDPGFN